MRDSNGSVLDLSERLLNLGISGVIDGRSGFIHEHDFGVLEEGSGKAEKLALALREVGSRLSDGGVEVTENVLVLEGSRRGNLESVESGIGSLRRKRGSRSLGGKGSGGLLGPQSAVDRSRRARWDGCVQVRCCGSANELDATKSVEDFFISEEAEGVEIAPDCAGEEGWI